MGVTLGLHRSLQRNSIQKVQFAYFHPLKKTSSNPKKQKMEAMLSFLGMRASKSYSDSGKSQAELSKKVSEDPKGMTESEWHDLLDGQTFYVTREKGTERPWTSCLNDEKEMEHLNVLVVVNHSSHLQGNLSLEVDGLVFGNQSSQKMVLKVSDMKKIQNLE